MAVEVAPAIRLAWARTDRKSVEDMVAVANERPGELRLLMSYVYRDQYKRASTVPYTDWMLDSGAFSAFWIGQKIELSDYIHHCREMLKNDPRLTEVIQLDVIGDWKKGRENLEKMWAEGIPALPVYHFGEPWEHLDWILSKWPYKICLGGAVGVNKSVKLRQVQHILRRVWPMRVHALGLATEEAADMGPLHSMDSSSWNSTKRYGVYPSLRNVKLLGVKGATSRTSIRYFLDVQRRAGLKWRKEWENVEGSLPPWPLRSYKSPGA